MSHDRDIDSIRSIIKYCEDVEDAIRRFGADEDDFLEDIHYRNSCAICIQYIGENVRKLSDEFKNRFPMVEWREITGFRNVIAHRYEDVDLYEMWVTVSEEVPELKRQCLDILERMRN